MLELARRAGVAENTVRSLYYEQAKGVTFEVMEKICAALDCQPGDLFERVGDREQG